MLDKIFNINKFNIFQDEDNYYFFRALNLADNKDLENGIILDENGKIDKIRTNLDRYEDIPKYKKEDDISLEQMINHIKMHQRKDTNCISLTSNANTALTYGRGNYSDRYIMVKVPKSEMKSEVYQAGLFMIDKVEEIISNYYVSGELDDIQKYYIDRINNASTSDELNRIKDEIKISSTENDEFQKGLIEITTSCNFNSLDEQQNFLKNKTILKLDVLNKQVVNGISNKFLIQTIGNAFSSLELIHYREIPGNKITYIPAELMDIFGLIQQLPSSTEYLSDLKKELLDKSQLIRINGKYTYDDFNVVEDELTLDKMFELTNGKMDYKTAYTLYKKAFYLCKSKLRTENSINLLKKIVGNNPKYNGIIDYISNNTFGIEPEITTRLSSNLISVSESVSLNFSNKETELFRFINSLNSNDAKRVMNEPFETMKILIERFMFDNDFVIGMSKDEWYANSIIDILDLRRFNVTENLNMYQRRDIINKMLEFDFINKFNYLKSRGFDNKTSVNLLFTSLIRNTENVSINNLFTLEELENFIGYNKIINTDFELRVYQKPVVERIAETFKTKKFTSAVLPTGAGKSYVALYEMTKYKDSDILYLAPNNEILDQIIATIRKTYHPEEHIPDHIEDVIKRKFPNLTLATYQILQEESAKDIIEKKYSLIVFDELHRTGAKEWSKKVNDLIDNQDEKVRVLGITATPERDVDLQNMTNYWASKLGYTEEEIDKEQHLSANLDIITAMKYGYICHPKVVCCEYSLIADGTYDEIKFKIDQLNDTELKKEIDYRYDKSRREVEKADGIEKILTDNLEQNGKYIVFLPVTRKKDGSFEDEDGNSISKTEASKIIKDYQMLMNQYLYSSNYFNLNGNILNSIYNTINSNGNLSENELMFLKKEKENILLLSSFSIISKPEALNTKNEIIADSIINYMNWEKLDKKIISKTLSSIMHEEVENLSMLGSYNHKKNKQNLSSFNQKTRTKKKFMFVMNKLNEGVHVEDIDGIIWLRPLDENSKILYLQQLGRCIFSVTNDSYKRPTVIDLVNNTLKVDFEKGLTDIDKDIIKISTVEGWVRTNNRLPFRTSEDQIELEFAEILNSLNKKYSKFLDEKAIIALPKENRNKIRRLIEIGSDIDLWNMETWSSKKERKSKENESFISFLGINPIVKDFLELKKEVEKNSLKDFDFYFDLLLKIKNQGDDINSIISTDKIKIEKEGNLKIIKRNIGFIGNEKKLLNNEEYNDNKLINLGSWLYNNQDKFTEEQKQKLRDIGYVLKGEEEDKFEIYYQYLIKLKEQGENPNLVVSDKIKINEDSSITIIKKVFKKINGKLVNINPNEYNDDDLISLGVWLYKNQDKFTEEQKQKLRDIGYVLKGEEEDKFEIYYQYLIKLKEQGENPNIKSTDKIKINEDSSITIIKQSNLEEYKGNNLVVIGKWLYKNQDKFTEEQKQKLRDIGYVLKGEEDKFEIYYQYLVKLKEQGENPNLARADKIKINEDSSITIIKREYKMIDGELEQINKEEYLGSDLIRLGGWLNDNQDKFTKEQKQKLRDIGYVLKGEEEDKFEIYYQYLVKLKEQGENPNLAVSDKIKINEDLSITIIKKKSKFDNGKLEIINKEEYNDNKLINLGAYFYRNQNKFTKEQKQKLRDIGYVLKEDAKKKFDESNMQFEADSHMSKVISNIQIKKENNDGRKLH